MSREAVPEPVKRQLRQESGFGCCSCGHPFIQYHHIIPYAEDPHMRADDMMTVCGQCHHLLTVDAIPIAQQRRWKQHPKNIVDNQARGTLYVTTDKLRVKFAGGMAVNTPVLLRVGQDQDIVRVDRSDDGRVLVSAYVQDSDGEVIAVVHRNEWRARPSRVWDFESYPKRAVIREAPRKISFSVDCRNDDILLQGEWFLGGQKVSFSPSKCLVGTNSLIGFHVEDCSGFLNIG